MRDARDQILGEGRSELRLRSGMAPADGTVYGTSRTSTKDFYTHHLRRIGLAAVLGTVKGVRRGLSALRRDRKMELVKAGALASGAF